MTDWIEKGRWYLRNRKLINRACGLEVTRYYAEMFKDLAVGIIAGLAAGLVVASFAKDWSFTFQKAELAIFIFGVSLTFVASGGFLAVSAALKEEEVKQEIKQKGDAAAFARIGRMFSWATVLFLLIIFWLFLQNLF